MEVGVRIEEKQFRRHIRLGRLGTTSLTSHIELCRRLTVAARSRAAIEGISLSSYLAGVLNGKYPTITEAELSKC